MISYHLLTEKGGRDHNEDYVGMSQSGERLCFALADGLGGHGKGELASRIAVEQAIAVLKQQECALKACIARSFEQGQKEILSVQREDRAARDMKTTFVLLLLGEREVWWGHIGDSRLYYFENCKLVSRTLDHSVPQMLASAGQIKEKQIRRHPDRNRLLRVMGTDWEEPLYQIEGPADRKAGQAFLLCSDGFWELIEEKKMISTLKKADSPKQWLENMEKIVIKQGRGQDMDNYSAVAVWID